MSTQLRPNELNKKKYRNSRWFFSHNEHNSYESCVKQQIYWKKNGLGYQ